MENIIKDQKGLQFSIVCTQYLIVIAYKEKEASEPWTKVKVLVQRCET